MGQACLGLGFGHVYTLRVVVSAAWRMRAIQRQRDTIGPSGQSPCHAGELGDGPRRTVPAFYAILPGLVHGL